MVKKGTMTWGERKRDQISIIVINSAMGSIIQYSTKKDI